MEAVNAGCVVANARRRLLRRFDLGYQVAPGRIPAGKLDAGHLADDAASPVASDEVTRPQRRPVRALDVDAPLVLREAGHLESVEDLDRQLADPVGHDPLDLVLPDAKRIGVTRREVAHVQDGRGQHRGLSHLALREETLRDATLIQHLDRARVKAAGPRPDEHVVGAPLDQHDVDLRQRELGREHHPRRAAAGDHHGMLGHGRAPAV